MTVPHTYESSFSIGGSDVAAIIGCNPHKSIHDVWTRLVKPEGLKSHVDNVRMEQGRFLEPLILAKFAADTEREVAPYGRVFHSKYPFLHATVDGQIIGGVRAAVDGPGIVEAKSFGIGNFKKIKAFGLDGLDEMYHVQLQHYLFVDNKKWGAFALFGREEWKLIPFDVERDEELIAKIEDHTLRFWNDYVLTKKRPPEEEFSIAFPRAAVGGKVESHSEAEWIAPMISLKKARDDKGLAEFAEEEAKSRLQELMGDRTHVTIPGVGKISWSESSQRSLNVNALKAAHPDINFSLYERRTATRPFRPTFSGK